MKLMRKLLAGALCAAMVMGTSLTAFASPVDATSVPTQAAISGTGTLEGWLDKTVTKIVLPTDAKTNYVLDPQGLLNVASSAAFKVTGGAVYFKNVSGSSITYSDTSDKLEIKNKSSHDVDVSLAVSITASGSALTQVALVPENEIKTVTKPALYLGLVTTYGAAKVNSTTAITAASVGVKLSAEKVPEVNGTTVKSGYIVSASAVASGFGSNEGVVTGTGIGTLDSTQIYYYKYTLTDDYEPGDAQTVSFSLTGKTSTDEGWGKVTENIKTEITYRITKAGGNATETSIEGGSYSRSSTSNTYEITFKSGMTDDDKTITKIVGCMDENGSGPANFAAGSYSISGSTLTLDGTKGAFGTGAVNNDRYVQVTFKNGEVVTFKVSVT